MGFSQLQDNLGNMTIVVDEACILFSTHYATKGEVDADSFKPETLLAFRTGAAPERNLLKDKQKTRIHLSTHHGCTSRACVA